MMYALSTCLLNINHMQLALLTRHFADYAPFGAPRLAHVESKGMPARF